jgi:hypothetical protein
MMRPVTGALTRAIRVSSASTRPETRRLAVVAFLTGTPT